ncbi:UNVERIFIED_ORG: hypothetical protein BDK47_1169 [Anoxybacillus amylolyticus]
MLKKLFLVNAVCDDGDYSELIVAESEKDAEKRFYEILTDNGEHVYFTKTREVSKVDGHKIVLMKEREL